MTGNRETQQTTVLLTASIALGITAGALTMLSRYVKREIRRRGFPSWKECQCELKTQDTIFQVWHSRHEQRGETIVTHEWGWYLTRPAQWQRQVLHYAAQVMAVLNPSGRHVEHISLRPQEARQYASLLRAGTAAEDESEPETTETSYIAWRSEILHYPRYLFDACTRRLYPAHITRERLDQASPLHAVWDPHSNLPLPLDGPLQQTPLGTRIDCIGWTPAQISYCTARVKG